MCAVQNVIFSWLSPILWQSNWCLGAIQGAFKLLFVHFVWTGGLSLAVEGPSKTEIKCVDNQDGTCTVSYLPTVPGEYNITVKFADKHIMGSPFTAKITRKSSISQYIYVNHFVKHFFLSHLSLYSSFPSFIIYSYPFHLMLKLFFF